MKIFLFILFFNLSFDIGYSQELIFVRNKLHWGILDNHLNVVQPPKFDEYYFIYSNPKRVAVRQNECWGILDETGKELVAPMYAKIYWYPKLENFMRVRKADSISFNYSQKFYNSKVGVIDIYAKTILPVSFDIISYYNGIFSAGVGVENVTESSYSGGTGTWTKYDTMGILMPENECVYISGARKIENDYYKHRAGDKYKYGILNCEGKVLIPYEYDEIKEQIVDGWIAVNKGAKGDPNGPISVPNMIGGKWGVSDLTGKVVVEIDYQGIRLFKNGMIGFCTSSNNEGKWGGMGRNKKIIIAPQYDMIGEINKDYFFARKDGLIKWYVIDKSGKLIRPEPFESAFSDKAGNILCLQKEDGSWLFMNREGKFSIPQKSNYFSQNNPSPDTVYSGIVFYNKIYVTKDLNVFFYDDFIRDEYGAIVKTKDKWGYIKPDGNWLINPEYDSLLLFSEHFTWGKKNGIWVVLNSKGIKQFEANPNITSVKPFTEGLAPIAINGRLDVFGKIINEKWGYIDINGKIVIECKFNDVMSFKSNIAGVKVSYKDKYLDGYKWAIINREGEIISKSYFDEIIY